MSMLKYEEIVSYIEEHIEDQTFIPNMKLPSLREMAGHFSTSVGTVLSAYKYLEQRTRFIPSPRAATILWESRTAAVTRKTP